jgi:hypothetical protein
MSPTCDDYVLCSARGKFGVVHVSVANHCPRLDSLDAGCTQHGSRPWQIDGGVARHGHDLWAVGASRAPHSRQATRQQNQPRLDVAGRNVLIRVAAYYLTAYGYYSGGRIAALSFLYEMRYRIGLVDDAVRGAVTERVADRIAIRQEAVRRNLGLSDHATAQVIQKFQRGICIPLADAPTDDGLLRPGHADENAGRGSRRHFDERSGAYRHYRAC